MSMGVRAGVLVAVLIAGLFLATQSAFSNEGPREVRWLISHEPVDAFERATAIFAQVLAKESNGALQLVVIGPEEVGLSAERDVPHADVMRLLASGDVEIASTFTVPIAREAPRFAEPSAPFLFDTYEEVNAYLESPEAEDILESFGGAKALAFTMSGGFYVIASKESTINDVDDLRGLRIATAGGPVAEAALKAFGAIPVSFELESEQVDLSSLDGAETTYARLSALVGSDSPYLRHINETNHSVFLTAILASNDFYDSLSAAEQRALIKAATAAAAVEREDSIALNEATKKHLMQNGSVVTELSPEARRAFISRLRSQ